MDLIERILSLNVDTLKRFENWLENSRQHSIMTFSFQETDFYLAKLNSEQFNDVILEETNDWFYLFCKNNSFAALHKICGYDKNLAKNLKPIMSASVWILKSNFQSFEIETPLLIYSPQHFENSVEKIDKDYFQLLKKLSNPKTKIFELTNAKRKSEEKVRKFR
jgi:hypothetical protein